MVRRICVDRRWVLGALLALVAGASCRGGSNVESWRFVSLEVEGAPLEVVRPLFLDITEDGFRAATTCNAASGEFGGDVAVTLAVCSDAAARTAEAYMLQALRTRPVARDDRLVFDDGTVRLVYEAFTDPTPAGLFAVLGDPTRHVDESALPSEQATGTVPPRFDPLVSLPSPSADVDLYLSVFDEHVCVVYGTATALDKWCHQPRFAAERSIVTGVPFGAGPLFRIALIPDSFGDAAAERADLGTYSDNLLVVRDDAPSGVHTLSSNDGATFTIVVPEPPAGVPLTSEAPGDSEAASSSADISSDAPVWEVIAHQLERARLDFAASGITSYRLTVEERSSYWTAGCTWTTVVSDGVVVATEAIAGAEASGVCEPFEFTVPYLHDLIAERLVAAAEPFDEMFGRHTLTAQFDSNGVPVRLEYDLANRVDEESSMTVTLAAEL